MAWDMDAEYKYWCSVAEQRGCSPVQFAHRWELMTKIYASATDAAFTMESALALALSEARCLGMEEDVARLVFGFTWARILYICAR